MTTPPSPQPTPGLVDYLPTDYPDTPHALPVPPPVPTPPALTPPASATTLAIRSAAPRRRLTWGARQLLIAAAVFVVLLLLGVTALAATSGTNTPDTPIRAMFTALDHHDGAALSGLGICHNSPLCTDRALTSGYQPPQHLQVGPAVLDGAGHATIVVHYDIDGTNHDDPIGVTGQRHGITGRQWTITEPPGATLHLHSTYWDTAHLAGIDTRTAPTANPDPSTTEDGIWAPPGRYTLTTRADPTVEAAHTDITITGDHHDQPITLTPTIRPDIQPQIDQQIHTRIDQCATRPDPNPTIGSSPLDFHSCPFTADVSYTITDSPHWTINSYPTTSLHLNDDGTISVQTTTPGEATYTVRWTLDIVPPQRWTTATIATPITISGHVVIDAGHPTWNP